MSYEIRQRPAGGFVASHQKVLDIPAVIVKIQIVAMHKPMRRAFPAQYPTRSRRVEMVNTPEQFMQIQKAALEVFQSATITSIEGLEKLAALNVQAAKASIDESTDALKSMTDVKDAKQLAEMATTSVQPATDKVTAYYKHVYEIANETGSELAKLFEKQFAEGNRQLYAAIDAMAKNAPAGSEGMVTLVKQAVSAANTAFDQVSKATKQAVEVAEANMAAAAKTTTAARARKAA
ncbi:MAG TPA: phasin family protein [Burkholderiaceae bacterium]|nr:phasin family protein [Burkholderiaceae bacterium]